MQNCQKNLTWKFVATKAATDVSSSPGTEDIALFFPALFLQATGIFASSNVIGLERLKWIASESLALYILALVMKARTAKLPAADFSVASAGCRIWNKSFAGLRPFRSRKAVCTLSALFRLSLFKISCKWDSDNRCKFFLCLAARYLIVRYRLYLV